MTDTSECKIEYKVSPSAWGGSEVGGNDLSAVIDEIIRRNGWEKRNAPLALPGPRSEPKEDVI